MPGQDGGVKVTLQGSQLQVDARPARMVSLLQGGVSVRVVDGPPHTQALPDGARRATFRIRDEMTVEATSAADFVALTEDNGRCLVVAFSGEVTVMPAGEGADRFALSAHEALIVPAGKGEPRVVSTAELSGSDQAEVDAVVDAAADALLRAPEPEPVPAVAAPAPAPAVPTPAPVKKAVPVKAAGQQGGGGGGGQRRKKGKKGRPQPPRPQKVAAKKAAAPAKAASKVAAGGGTPPPPPKPPSGGGGGGGRGGGGDDIEPEEETPRERRLLAIATVLAVLVAIVVIVVLTGRNNGKNVAADNTTTTAEVTSTTSAPTTTTASTSTSTSVKATTTTAPATTTTAARPTTTTTPPVQPDYAVAPKSCVQNGNKITYTATITNKAKQPFDFTVSVSFKDASGGEVAKATANVTRLASGRSADFSATGTSSKPLANSGASCNVTNIDATPSK